MTKRCVDENSKTRKASTVRGKRCAVSRDISRVSQPAPALAEILADDCCENYLISFDVQTLILHSLSFRHFFLFDLLKFLGLQILSNTKLLIALFYFILFLDLLFLSILR